MMLLLALILALYQLVDLVRIELRLLSDVIVLVASIGAPQEVLLLFCELVLDVLVHLLLYASVELLLVASLLDE